ncbi:hypothetical protein LZ496_02010 [Sphingomonas sp. NSE70-1]|uniref:Gas vesicle protein n=1 Tax=Sphingomonas caseinilyticus TaxID=2908205 RepID=A0ABT0RS93_9SPHN|nr:hypothetical protein [Sphingomonas caseinilyticus]MCL6697560.1 hypothetical protein [Sphingomonas caseinilyticus]
MARQQQKKNQTSSAQSPRERAIEAYDSARERTRDGIDAAPIMALGGGLALGALIAALLPRTETEKKLVGPLGGRITDGARAAASAAKEASREKLSELNITREAGKGVVQSVLDGIGEAARTGGQAAVGAVRNKG